MKILALSVLLLAGQIVYGQQENGNVVVHKDPRVDLLVAKQVEVNEVTTRNTRRMANGFRIQVINTNDRNKANEAKTKVYQSFPELKPYLIYQAPFFKLKVGNFKNREEAEQYIDDLKRLFPSGVYVVRDIIELGPR